LGRNEADNVPGNDGTGECGSHPLVTDYEPQ